MTARGKGCPFHTGQEDLWGGPLEPSPGDRAGGAMQVSGDSIPGTECKGGGHRGLGDSREACVA